MKKNAISRNTCKKVGRERGAKTNEGGEKEGSSRLVRSPSKASSAQALPYRTSGGVRGSLASRCHGCERRINWPFGANIKDIKRGLGPTPRRAILTPAAAARRVAGKRLQDEGSPGMPLSLFLPPSILPLFLRYSPDQPAQPANEHKTCQQPWEARGEPCGLRASAAHRLR